MFIIGKNKKWVSNPPKETELKRLTIAELVQFAKQKRSIKHPFKKMLINYILNIYQQNV